MANPFAINPSGGVDTGRQLAGIGNLLRENREKREAEEKAQQDQAAFMKAFESRNPKDIAAVAARNPQAANLIYKQMGIESEQQKRDMADFSRQILTASPERREELYRRRIKMIQERGGDASDTIESLNDYMADPEGELQDIEFIYAGADPKGYGAFTKARESKADRTLKVDEINIKKEGLALRKEEARLRAEQQKLQNETNAVKREELELKIEERQRKIDQQKKDVQAAAESARDNLNKSVDTVDRLLNHPGLEAAVGTSAVIPSIPGTDRADFEAELDAFDAQNFLTAIKQMKGMGALSDAEGRKVSAAVGAINPKMSEAAFKKSLMRIKDTFELAKQRMVERGEIEPDQPASVDDLVNKYAN